MSELNGEVYECAECHATRSEPPPLGHCQTCGKLWREDPAMMRLKKLIPILVDKTKNLEIRWDSPGKDIYRHDRSIGSIELEYQTNPVRLGMSFFDSTGEERLFTVNFDHGEIGFDLFLAVEAQKHNIGWHIAEWLELLGEEP